MATELPAVSVVIPARNAAATIGEQLAALSRQEYSGRWEVIVADNGSSDSTARIAAEWVPSFARLRLVSACQRRGINVARNAGIRAATGEVILGCDADDVVAPGWVSALAEALQHFDAVGGSIDETSLNPPEVMAWTPRMSPPGLEGPLPYPHGSNCGFRTSAWRELGGFNETYRRGGTETEFFWRLQLASFRVGFEPRAVVMYRRRSSQLALLRQYFWWGYGRAHLHRDLALVMTPALSLRMALRAAVRGRPPSRLADCWQLAMYAGCAAGRARFTFADGVVAKHASPREARG